MTPDELEKEAERVLACLNGQCDCECTAHSRGTDGPILRSLRAVHDAAIEKVAVGLKELDELHDSFKASELADAVRALKLSPEAGGNK